MTDELKKALESAKTEEEKKAVAEKFKEEIQKLTPEELDKVAGGDYYPGDGKFIKLRPCDDGANRKLPTH